MEDIFMNRYEEYSDEKLELMYYVEFGESLPVFMGTYPGGPIYRELMIKALKSGKPFTYEELERKMQESGHKSDLVIEDDD